MTIIENGGRVLALPRYGDWPSHMRGLTEHPDFDSGGRRSPADQVARAHGASVFGRGVLAAALVRSADEKVRLIRESRHVALLEPEPAVEETPTRGRGLLGRIRLRR